MSSVESAAAPASVRTFAAEHVRPRLDSVRLLAAAVVATMLGLTAAAFRNNGTAVNAFLFMEAGFSHIAACWIERSAVSLALLSSTAGMIWHRGPLFVPAAACILGEAVARWHVQGEAFSDWVLMSQSARYVTPLVLVLLLFGSIGTDVVRQWPTKAGEWGLKIGLAMVFTTHGLQAIQGNPVFVDLIISSSANLIDVRIAETAARSALQVIGWIDVVVAAALLFRPVPTVLWWAAFWAGVTAFSRMTASGMSAYPDMLVRTSYILGPVAVYLLIARKPRRISS